MTAEGNDNNPAVVIDRTLDAPVQLVWQMWTDPEHFAAWYGPDGATTRVARMEVRVGGTRLVSMSVNTPRGATEMWFTGAYREVVENQRLVYTESPSDELGKVLSPSAAGMPGEHPTTTVVMVELEDLGGRTRMVLTHSGIHPDSPGASGWRMALDKLAARIATDRGA